MELGLDGKKVLKLLSTLEKILGKVDKRELLLLLEVPLLPAQEEIGLALKLLWNVV